MRSICTAEYNSIGKNRIVCFVCKLAWGQRQAQNHNRHSDKIRQCERNRNGSCLWQQWLSGRPRLSLGAADDLQSFEAVVSQVDSFINVHSGAVAESMCSPCVWLLLQNSSISSSVSPHPIIRFSPPLSFSSPLALTPMALLFIQSIGIRERAK